MSANNPPLDRRRPIAITPLERDSTAWVPGACFFAAGMVAMWLVLV